MRFTSVLTLLALAAAPLPALATSCAEQIGTIQRRLDSAGAVQITGLQDGHTLRSGSPHGVAGPRLDAPSDPALISTAGHIADARHLLARATDEDRTGAQRACENTMTEAKGMIGALP